jgi:NDP-sugar pyrophosphorylase family protein
VVVGPTSVGADTRIEEGSLVCRSVIWSGCHVGAHSFVDASVVGDGIVVPAYGSIEGEVRMNQARHASWREAFAADAPRRERVPVPSLADLAVP